MTSVSPAAVSPEVLHIDAEAVAEQIIASLRESVGRTMRRQGGVVGASGGIDSSVTLGLCARALGPDRTLALLMPEADSDPDTLRLSSSVAAAFGVPTELEDITEILRATGCYERRAAAVREVVPQFGE